MKEDFSDLALMLIISGLSAWALFESGLPSDVSFTAGVFVFVLVHWLRLHD